MGFTFYLIKRILLIIPTLLLTLLFTLYISDSIPTDPVEDSLNSRIQESSTFVSPKTKKRMYDEMKIKYGLYLPVFYFNVKSSIDAPDSVYKTLLPSDRIWLDRVIISQNASWKVALAFKRNLLELLNGQKLSESSLNDLELLNNSFRNRDIVKILNKHKGDLLFDCLSIQYANLKENSISSIDKYIPSFRWNGKQCQFHSWISKLIRGKLGYSLIDKRSIGSIIKDVLPWTILLNITSFIIIFIIGIPLGFFKAIYNNSYFDKISTQILNVFYGIPQFWLAGLLLTYFAGIDYLNLFPVSGVTSPFIDYNIDAGFYHLFLDVAWHLILPVFCISMPIIAVVSNQIKQGLLDFEDELFATTSKAKGNSNIKTMFIHGMSIIKVLLVSQGASIFSGILSGAIIIETIFSLPGMGTKGFTATQSQDYPLLYIILLMTVLFITVVNLIMDVCYTLVDPRIKFSKSI